MVEKPRFFCQCFVFCLLSPLSPSRRTLVRLRVEIGNFCSKSVCPRAADFRHKRKQKGNYTVLQCISFYHLRSLEGIRGEKPMVFLPMYCILFAIVALSLSLSRRTLVRLRVEIGNFCSKSVCPGLPTLGITANKKGIILFCSVVPFSYSKTAPLEKGAVLCVGYAVAASRSLVRGQRLRKFRITRNKRASEVIPQEIG